MLAHLPPMPKVVSLSAACDKKDITCILKTTEIFVLTDDGKFGEIRITALFQAEPNTICIVYP